MPGENAVSDAIPEILIRDVSLTDSPGLGRLHVDTWQATYKGIIADEYLLGMSYEKSTAMFERMLKKPFPGLKTFVADAGDEIGIVGAATVGFERRKNHEFRGELHGIYVLPAFQHQGIGLRLVSAATVHLRKLGLRNMLVWVLADNPYRFFYEKLGGRIVEERWEAIGGQDLKELAYGWPDIRIIASRS
jgi:ribosomal protein S18 acetylase RimI-like enzyme